MDEQKCCEFVNADLSSTMSYIQKRLAAVLNDIDANAALDGSAGLSKPTRKTDALQVLIKGGSFRELARKSYQKILDSKCNGDCCKTASAAIRDLVSSYVEAVAGNGNDPNTGQLNSTALKDSTGDGTLESYLADLKASLEDELTVINSTTDCKDGCGGGDDGGRKEPCRRTRYKIECPRRRCKKRSFKKYSCSLSEKEDEPCECKDH